MAVSKDAPVLRITGIAIAAGAVLSLAACAGAGLGERGGSTFTVGDNLVQESCRAEVATLDSRLSAAGLAARQHNVYCGEWERPSGRIFTLVGSGAAPDNFATQGPWAQAMDQLAACEPSVATVIFADTPALALDCRLREGGWPYSAFVAAVDGDIYLADGIPSSLPVLERTVAVLSGRSQAQAAEASDAVRRIEQNFAGRLFGTGDLDAYQTLLRLGSYYNSIRSFAEAESAYRQALEIHARVLGTEDAEYGDPLMHLALEVSNQERFSVADELFAQADALVESAADQADKARLLSYRALHAANQRRYEEAVKLARQATEMRRKIAAQLAGLQVGSTGSEIYGAAIANLSSSEPVLQSASSVAALDTAQSLSTEAAMLLRLDRAEDARQVVDEALALVEASSQTPEFWRPQLLLRSAEVDVALGNLQAAEQSARFGLAQLEQLYPGSRAHALAWMQLGHILADQGRPDEAISNYDQGLAMMRARGLSLRGEEIEGYLDLLYERLQATPADGQAAMAAKMFDAAQLVRGAVVAQTISEATSRLSASDQAVGALIRELQDTRRRRDSLLFSFNSLAARAVTGADRRALDDLRAQIQELERRIDELEPQVQAAAPTLNVLRDKAASLEEVAPLLGAKEALLQFLVGRRQSYAFLVRSGGVTVERVPVEGRILAEAVRKLKDAFVVRRDGGGARIGAFDAALAHLLYERLLGPFDAEVREVERLVVVPSGPLLGLPFGVLVTEPPPPLRGADYSAVSFLVERTGLVTAPSTRAFVDLRQRAGTSKAPRPFLGLGDFAPSGNPEPILASRGLPPNCRDGALAVANARRLPGTAGQLRTIANALGAEQDSIVLGEAFSEARLRELPLEDYRVLVFATHALLPGELDCLWEPSLVLSRPASAPAEDDGLLSYYEILDLKLDADIVVLSACNTGGPLSQNQGLERGVEISNRQLRLVSDTGEDDRARGESLAGLTRAFFYAGARSLLVSNWEVYADATVALMSDTFNRMTAGGLDLSAALQEAQIDFAADPSRSHPYLWGSFIIVGEGAVRAKAAAQVSELTY
ncbi:MAG: CHAT domain-containing protein [Rhodospirillales bacterium]|nr:CHAT domain-containing protein [Rhodospirillales bacterium]